MSSTPHKLEFLRFSWSELSKAAKYLLFGSLSILILLLPAFYNGYPIFHPDCGTYLRLAFTDYVAHDRPLGYGLFIKFSCINTSLWFTIIWQGLILYFLILQIIKLFTRVRNPEIVAFIVIVILSVLTPLGIYVSLVTPDIQLAFLILSILILSYSENLNSIIKLVLYFLIFLVNISHYSTLLLSVSLSVFLIFIHVFRKRNWSVIKSQGAIILLITILSFGILKIANYSRQEIKEVAKGRNIIMLARFVNTEILTDYLIKEDTDKKYSLSQDIELLKNMNSPADFVWNPNSPLHKGNCQERDCWDQKSDEYGDIIKQLLTSYPYNVRLIKLFTKDAVKQFFTIKTKNHFKVPLDSPIATTIETKFPKDYPHFSSSKQVTGRYDNRVINLYHKIIHFTTSMLFLVLIVLVFLKKYRMSFFGSFLLVFLALWSNAIICAILSNVVGRYQGRIAWIMVLWLVVIILNYRRRNAALEFKE